jgi:hypothetical protein
MPFSSSNTAFPSFSLVKARLCMPVTCIPQACLAIGVTQADLSGLSSISAVPAKDLIPPQQSLDNMLKNFADGTPVDQVFGGTPVDVLRITCRFTISTFSTRITTSAMRRRLCKPMAACSL